LAVFGDELGIMLAGIAVFLGFVRVWLVASLIETVHAKVLVIMGATLIPTIVRVAIIVGI
jgi:hypothetical protein